MVKSKIKLLDTSVFYDDGSKSERFTDTGNIETADFKAVPYEYRYSNGYTERVPRYFFLYKRCKSGQFGEYVDGIKREFSSIAECENFLNTFITGKVGR